jgi:hypothetical protein
MNKQSMDKGKYPFNEIFKYRSKKSFDNKYSMSTKTNVSANSNERLLSAKISLNNFISIKKLGQGGFSKVKLGNINNIINELNI